MFGPCFVSNLLFWFILHLWVQVIATYYFGLSSTFGSSHSTYYFGLSSQFGSSYSNLLYILVYPPNLVQVIAIYYFGLSSQFSSSHSNLLFWFILPVWFKAWQLTILVYPPPLGSSHCNLLFWFILLVWFKS